MIWVRKYWESFTFRSKSYVGPRIAYFLSYTNRVFFFFFLLLLLTNQLHDLWNPEVQCRIHKGSPILLLLLLLLLLKDSNFEVKWLHDLLRWLNTKEVLVVEKKEREIIFNALTHKPIGNWPLGIPSYR